MDQLRSSRLAAGFGLLLLASACGQAEVDADATGGTMAAPEDAEEEIQAIPVEVAMPTRGDVYDTYSGTAPVEAYEDATVIAKVGGEVREILVEEGDDVVAGQVLARLDGDRLRFEQKQTEANLRKLERDFARNIELAKKGLISDGDFEKIKYDLEALKAANDLAKLTLSYADIRAPISGVVAERFVKIGNTIEIETPVFHLTSLEPLVAYLYVPEREYRTIRAGQRAAVSVDALDGTLFPATVARISPVVDPQTGTFKITVEVNDDTRRLKPGMFGRVSIVQDMHANVLQVPRSSLIDDGGAMSIFVVDGDTVARRPVTTGYTFRGHVEIVGGIEENERFVVVGQSGLKDGSRVIIIDDEAADDSNEESRTAQHLETGP